MKNLLTILLVVFTNTLYSQCVFNETSTLTPPPVYESGDIVQVSYTLPAFTGINVNWIHAIQINLGIGWINLTPGIPPGNITGSAGNWLWDNQHIYPISNLNFGPGWRFINTTMPQWGTISNGPFTITFTVEVAETCTPDDLSISISIFDDCETGGWTGGGGGCCNDPSFQIYNGTVLIVPVNTSLIYHY
jgi:hypothetical protein|tara:strand:- start:62 stop:631 length:570 start_codon:yes stop_codon:yes gene_type:complete